MEKTPQEILRDFFNECDEEVHIHTEEEVLAEDCNILKVSGEINGESIFLFSLMGVNLKTEFERLFKEVCDSYLHSEDYDSAD